MNNAETSSICESRIGFNENEDEILCRAEQILYKHFKRSNYLLSPDTTRNYLKLLLAREHRELFIVIFLDTQNGVLDHQCLFKGSIESATVYPREVVKAVLDRNAASVILSHNHPSGNAEPSTQDKIITSRIVSALETIDVRVLDHIIVGGSNTISFAEQGLI